MRNGRINGSIMEKIKITYWHSQDMQGIYYGGGFKQWIHFDVVFDAPAIVRTEETIANGNGVETVVHSRTVERCRFEIPDLPDALLNAMTIIRDHDNIEVEWFMAPANSANPLNVITKLTAKDWTLTSREQPGGCFNVGEVEFEVVDKVFVTCGADYFNVVSCPE